MKKNFSDKTPMTCCYKKHAEAFGWIVICFAVLYFGGHLIVALSK